MKPWVSMRSLKQDKGSERNNKKPFSLREWLFSVPDDRGIFYLGLVAAAVFIIVWIIYMAFFDGMIFTQCAFRKATGFYCPGCGGTRSVKALLSGHFIKAFLLHPFVPYCIIMWILYEGSHILEILHVPHVKGMKFRTAYVWVGLRLLFTNWRLRKVGLVVMIM